MERIVFKDYECTIKDLNTEKGIVDVYINAFDNEDSDGDVSLPGSFKRTFKNVGNSIQHWLNHNRDYLIGVPIKLYEDTIGALAISQLNINKQLGRDVFEDYKLFAEHGKTLQHSVRVAPVKFEEERIGDKTIRRVSEWKMIMEFSTLYGWGANQKTPLNFIKSINDLELMMREGNYSDEKSKLIEDTYEKLKRLLDNDPHDTHESDPPALDNESDLIKQFYYKLKI